jgi:hypothetical protein
MRQQVRSGTAIVVSAMAMTVALAAQRYTPATIDVEPVAMRASCAADAVADVDRGAALLLLLARGDARRAFERAVASDPDCALGYWGQAVSQLPAADEPLTDAALAAGAEVTRRAVAVPARTPVERSLVESIAALFTPSAPTPIGVRLDAYEKQLGALATRHPDLEALAMLHVRAVLLRTTLPRDDARRRALTMLERAWRDRPLPPGAAIALVEASAGARTASIAGRAADALARVRLPGAHAMALRWSPDPTAISRRNCSLKATCNWVVAGPRGRFSRGSTPTSIEPRSTTRFDWRSAAASHVRSRA